MSLRKAKKLLEQKKAIETNIVQDQEEEDDAGYNKKPTNMFSFNVDDDSENDQDIQKKEQEDQTMKIQQKTKKKKKNKKKKLTQNKTEQQKPEQQQEDVEKIFKQAGLEYKKNQGDNNKDNDDQQWELILSINENKFNYEKQLRKHFGDAKFQDKDDDPQLTKKQQRMQKHLKKMMKKSVLSPGIKDFIPIRQKFQMDRQQDKIKFMPTKKYDHFQVEYQSIRNSNDINALIMFSQTHPQHVDSLYFIGQFLRLQGNYRDADNLIQKVIYIYEAAAGYDLNEFIKVNVIKKHIVYDIYSTSLFMSLFKFMDILGKKGCFRAALQYNKYLLKINMDDPTACLLCIDYNAISSKNNKYLLSFVKNYSKYIGKPDTTLYLVPNFTYSVALAKFHLNNSIGNQKQKQDLVVEQNNIDRLVTFTQQHWKQALHLSFKQNIQHFQKQDPHVLLLRAILIYPNLIYQIADKNQYAKQFMNHPKFKGNQQKPFKQILKHQFWENIPTSYSYYFLKLQNANDSHGLDKVLEVYVERSKILWKSKEVMMWVKAALGFILNQIDQGNLNYQQFLQKLCVLNQDQAYTVPFNMAKYAHISKANFSDRVQQVDLANIQDNQQIQPQNQNRMNVNQGNAFSLFMNSLLPWVNLPGEQRNQQFDPDMPDIHDD